MDLENHVNRLLAVTLKEEEINRSLQVMNNSLNETFSVLSSSFSEVKIYQLQRKQYIDELSRLKAENIRILQEMKNGYSEQSLVGEEQAVQCFMPSYAQPPIPISQPPIPLPSKKRKKPKKIPKKKPIRKPGPIPPLPSLQASSASAAVTGMLTRRRKHEAKLARQVAQLLKSHSNKKSGDFNEAVLTGKEKESNALQMPVYSQQPPTAPLLSLPTASATTPATPKIGSFNSANARPSFTPAAQHVKQGKGEMGNLRHEAVPTGKRDIEMLDIEMLDNKDKSKAVQNVPNSKEKCASTQTVKFKKLRTNTVSAVSSKGYKTSPKVNAFEHKQTCIGTFKKRRGPVNCLQIHEDLLFTCSGNEAWSYNLVSKKHQAVFKGHSNTVTCLVVSPSPSIPCLFTGSNDHTIRYFDIQSNKCMGQISVAARVLCLHIAMNTLYAGLYNGLVVRLNRTTFKQLDMFKCHGSCGVCSLATAKEAGCWVLLVGSSDGTISVCQASTGLVLRTLNTHTKTVLCIAVLDDLAFSGSFDSTVYAHNIHTGELLHMYMGHSAPVVSIVILENVIVTACLDRLVRIYKLQSHNCLQVYGGNRDMVMYMAVHECVIYTGCYDGSVQTVKLDFFENYRCYWYGCTVIFGVAEHLLKHLLEDHASHQGTVKCRWRGCDLFFSTSYAVMLEMPDHMKSHVDTDSKLES